MRGRVGSLFLNFATSLFVFWQALRRFLHVQLLDHNFPAACAALLRMLLCLPACRVAVLAPTDDVLPLC